MARTHPHTSSDAASPSTSSSRITKSTADRSSSRTTRQRSRRLAEASSSGLLQGMVEEAQHVTAGASESSSSRGKGKSKAVDQPELEFGDFDDDWTMIEEDEKPVDPCPVTDKDINPFRIMDLPTEIRLEIYRACLTRPYNILLSKREQPHHFDMDLDVDDIDVPEDLSGGSDEDGDTSLRHQMGSARTQSTSGSHRRSNRHADFTNALRAGRPRRLLPSRTATSSGSSNVNAISPAAIATISRRTAPRFRHRSNILQAPEPERNQTADPLLVNILRASKEIYKEARGVFYSENVFTLDLNTAMSTLACLHQRSRRQIKHVELEIPSYNEILERFQETVRLNLRYCSGLKKLVIHMPFTLPGADGSGTTGNTTVYANGFDILRWLPQECAIILKGNICTEIETVVNKHLHLAKTLDKLAYARRQLISNDTGPSTAPAPTTTATG